IIYRIARENQFLKKAFIEKVRQAEPHQIVCYVKCPHCNYNGFSLQNGCKLLSTKFTVLCEKCQKQVSIHLG
ncbi:hypothetical protein KEJ32_05220, partial [Candidatus Bathyarchaeota archaeon]|nr:hypothetical protein [Candidatus Bathyarchaeota archaeon]